MTAPISAIGTTVPVDPTVASSTAGVADNTQLSSKAFLQLLVAQLQYQDPSKPVDTSSFMTETATLTQVQSMEQSSKNSSDMLTAQRAQTAAGLVGHTVSYLGTDGTSKTGVVTSATISAAEPMLQVGSTQVALTQIQQVLSTPAAASS